MEVYRNTIEVDYKEDKSPLTQADRQAHQAIVKHLSSTGIPILSEEGKQTPYSERTTWKQFWMVDPLDGTKEFIKRNGEFTVNIALIQGGVPVWGVVYAPDMQTIYWGGEEGAFKAAEVSTEMELQQFIQVAEPLKPNKVAKPYKVVASRSHLSQETQDFVETIKEEHGEVEFVSMGSSLKICLVAEGTAQVYPRFAPTMEWDTAAGHAVAKAAGCKVRHTDSEIELSYNKENLRNPWFIVEPN